MPCLVMFNNNQLLLLILLLVIVILLVEIKLMRLIIKQIVILLDVYKNNSNPMWKKYTNLLNSLDKLYKGWFYLMQILLNIKGINTLLRQLRLPREKQLRNFSEILQDLKLLINFWMNKRVKILWLFLMRLGIFWNLSWIFTIRILYLWMKVSLIRINLPNYRITLLLLRIMELLFRLINLIVWYLINKRMGLLNKMLVFRDRVKNGLLNFARQ